jgi:hypothetical protein
VLENGLQEVMTCGLGGGCVGMGICADPLKTLKTLKDPLQVLVSQWFAVLSGFLSFSLSFKWGET